MSETISRRDVALLHAVAAERCEIVHGSLPVLFVDGRVCCDSDAGRRLIRAGLLVRPGLDAGRWPARLTDVGQARLDARRTEPVRRKNLSGVGVSRVLSDPWPSS